MNQVLLFEECPIINTKRNYTPVSTNRDHGPYSTRSKSTGTNIVSTRNTENMELIKVEYNKKNWD